MRASALLPAVLPLVLAVLAACSSQPEMDRPSVPDRPEVQRPEGVEPEGLAEMRDTIASQRAEARELENAAIITPNAMGTHPTTPWYDPVLDTVSDLVMFLAGW